MVHSILQRMTATHSESEGSAALAKIYAVGPARVQYQNKDPRGWAAFAERLGRRNATGAALTVLGVQSRRPSPHDLTDELAAMTTPILIIAGDEDDGVIDTSVMLKRTIHSSALSVFPRSGHLCNLEEPALFNSLVADFHARVDAGRWATRDPRSLAQSITGVDADSR